MMYVLKGAVFGFILGSLIAIAVTKCAAPVDEPSSLPSACFDVDIIRLKCGERAV